MKKFLNTASLFLLSCLFLYGQQPHPAFRNISTNEGLPSPEVYDILQDKKGYIWFSTDNGVSRYNGYEVRNFGPQDGLKNNVVFKLYEDFRGYIWMATMSENLYYYDYKQDTILSYIHNSVIKEHLPRATGQKGIYIDRQGTLFKSMRNKGFLKIKENGDYQLYVEENINGPMVLKVDSEYLLNYSSFPHNQLDSNLLDQIKKGRRPFVLFETQKPSTKKWIPSSPYSSTQYSLKLSDNTLLLFAFGYLYHFKEGELLWQSPSNFEVITAFQNKQGEIFLGGNKGKGLRKFKNTNSLYQNQYTTYLEGFSIAHIMTDNEMGLWCASLESGVFYAPNPQFLVYDKSTGLTDSYVTSVEVKNREELYLGMRKGGAIFHLNSPSNTLTKLPQKENPRNSEVFDLYFDKVNQKLWAGIYPVQVFKDNSWKKTRTKSGYSSTVKKFSFSNGKLWGCNSNGFEFFDLENDLSKFHSRQIDFNERILTTFETDDERLLLGTPSGLKEFKNNSITSLPLNLPFSNLRIEDIAELNDNTLVIGTKGRGVLFWKEELLQAISLNEGLTSTMIENIHIDVDDNIWVGTLNGLNLIKIDPQKDPIIETFTLADGLPSNEINDIDSSDDQLWAATTKGLVKIPRSKKQIAPSKPVQIESIYVNGKVWPDETTISLPYSQNNLQINFLALNYKLNGQINYRYRLNSEDDWMSTLNRSINYAALSPGDFNFEIQAQNQNNQWSESTFLPFTIRPPYWRKWWFWAICMLVISSLVYLFYRYRLQSLRSQAAFELEKAASEKEISELKQSALQAQMNPHFIFNCLNSIQGFIAKGDKINATHYLSRFARLIRKSLNASSEAKVSLEDEIQILDNYLELESIRFKNSFEYAIQTEKEISPLDILIPPLLIQPYVENALIHGLADSQKKGIISIQFQVIQNYLKVIITDNGIGITEAKRRKLNKSGLHKSVGMMVTQKRLELIDQKDKSEKVKIEELKNSEGTILGTQVILKIKTIT